MSHFLPSDLPHDLPVNWTTNQYVSPNGTEVGLTEQHGYNYLNNQVNLTQEALIELSKAVSSGLDNIVDNGYLEDPVNSLNGYIVLKGTKYYRDTALTQLSSTTIQPLVAQYVDNTYGTITVSTTTYYVSFADMYEGYVPGARAYTFDRWSCVGGYIIKDKSGTGITIAPSSTYVPCNVLQPIVDPKRLASRTVTFSAVVESVSGAVTLGLAYSDTSDAVFIDYVSGGKMALSAGMNIRTTTIPANIGSGMPHLFAYIYVPVGGSVTIKAIKLQLGEQQTLAYDDGDSLELVQMPNKVLEYLRCVGAPPEYGGRGTVALTSSIVDATVE